jgi:hypothetical protein
LPVCGDGERRCPSRDSTVPVLTRLAVSRDVVVALALHRQHLTAAARGDDVLAVMADILGLHATVPISPYLQLHARLREFTPARLDRVLDGGHAAKVSCMRRTLFIETAEIVPLVLTATRQLSRPSDRYLEANGLTVAGYDELAAEIENMLTGRAMTVKELNAVLAVGYRLSPVVIVMCDQSRLLRWKGRRGWRSAQPSYRRFAEALPHVHLDILDEPAAVRQLVERYVGCYGPVTESDIAWWTGLSRRTVRTAVASLSTLVPVDVKGVAEGFLMHARDIDTPAGDVVLLPALDPYLQSHRDRSRYVDAAHLPYVVDRGGNVTSTIIVRGRVIGVWDHLDKPNQMRLLFFDAPSRRTRDRARRAATDVGVLLSGCEPAIVEFEHMTALAGSTGAFLSPLRRAR